MTADTPPRTTDARHRARRRLPRGCAALVFASAFAAGSLAHAQTQPVRKCLLDGRLVFQSAPCPEGRAATHLASTPAPMPPVTTAAAKPGASEAPKKRTLAELLRERDAADRARPAFSEHPGDGAAVLRSRMGAV